MNQQPKKSSSIVSQSEIAQSEISPLKIAPSEIVRPIFIIEDDPDFAEIYQKHLVRNFPEIPVRIFYNAIEANEVFSELSEEELPSLIILDILLTGPDGFTLLNELLSYPETSQIPVLLISSLNLGQMSLQAYNVRAILNKETFTPDDFVTKIKDILSPAPKTPSGDVLELVKTSPDIPILSRSPQIEGETNA
ncbi:response regulator [TM7 phylum sp. oral taxon 351]|nr:response regulator [TM7 phylum sp. oral taxon 351]